MTSEGRQSKISALHCVTRRLKMNQTLTIRIPDELREELQEISQAEGKPVSDLVRESL